jgi:hypothetical protein
LKLSAQDSFVKFEALEVSLPLLFLFFLLIKWLI